MDNETEGSHAAESDMELDLLAESESDSDESNAGEIDDGQRSDPGPSSTRATGSLSGVSRSRDNDNVDYYTEEESIAEGDEEEEEEEEDDENDNHVEQTEQVPLSGNMFVIHFFTS